MKIYFLLQAEGEKNEEAKRLGSVNAKKIEVSDIEQCGILFILSSHLKIIMLARLS